MRYGFPDLRQGFEVEADVVIIGSGAGGAVAALNLAEGGMRTVVLEAGPELRPEMMDKDAPRFMARYYWEGGLRAIGGSAQIPSLQGRCLGGSTVVNSAIMLRLPDWVREEWASGHHLEFLRGPGLEESYARIEARCHVTPTPEAVQGRRNRVTRAALAAVGMPGGPLPRAVKDCQGCADCLTGCAGGHKQSTDRSYLPDAERHGAQVYCSAEVERILVEGGRAVGVTGRVVDPLTKEVHRRFTVRAKRVVVAAGAAHTPVLLLESGLNPGGLVGATFHAHLGGGIIGMMEEPTDPFVGATQGWGAISSEIKGLKYEGLWAAQGLLLMRWGGLGAKFLERLHEIRHTAVIAQVYRAKVKGSVQRGLFGGPKMRLQIPRDEARVFCAGHPDRRRRLAQGRGPFCHDRDPRRARGAPELRGERPSTGPRRGPEPPADDRQPHLWFGADERRSAARAGGPGRPAPGRGGGVGRRRQPFSQRERREPPGHHHGFVGSRDAKNVASHNPDGLSRRT